MKLILILTLMLLASFNTSAATRTHQGTGTVVQIDRENHKIELKHGPIKSLNWMGMKMFFSVDDDELLDELEQGDNVQFHFIQTPDNRYVVTDVEFVD